MFFSSLFKLPSGIPGATDAALKAGALVFQGQLK